MFLHISEKESCKAPVKQINHLKQSSLAGPVRYRFELVAPSPVSRETGGEAIQKN